jgi:hypothetical protein
MDLQTRRRPHLAADGNLCDEDRPCIHERRANAIRREVLLIGGVVGAVIGTLAASAFASILWERLGSLAFTAIVVLSLGAGIVCFTRWR